MKISVKQNKKETEIRERQTEAELISAEAGIMSVDIEKVPPPLSEELLSWNAAANHGM